MLRPLGLSLTLSTLLLAAARARADAPPLGEPDVAAPSAEDANEDPLDRPTGQTQKHRSLAEIKKSGYIKILTRNNSTSFFIYRGHRLGFDYELGKRLAQQLGIRAQFVVPRSWGDLIPSLQRGEGDVIAGEMTVTPERAQAVQFAGPYLSTFEVPVWKKGTAPITKPEDLAGKKVEVRKSSSYWGTLQKLSDQLRGAGKPAIELVPASEEEETDDLVENVARGSANAPYSVADQLIAKQMAGTLDDLEVGPPLSDKTELAWAAPLGDTELTGAIDTLFRAEKKVPEFNILKHTYFEAPRELKKRDAEKAVGHGSLSPYDPLIIKAAKKYGYDWRLVAAQVYQESRFDPTRKSWCGATGLFQIMPATAKGLGITDPTDPAEGIEGGAKYMAQIMKHFAAVPDPVERYKMAMAGYNCGPGHVDDARAILKAQNKSSDTWSDVQVAMLQLSKEKVHGQTAHGYCRCGEPVDYVRHITERYDGYRQLVPDTDEASAAMEKKGK